MASSAAEPRPLLGASVYGAAAFADPGKALDQLSTEGFKLVSFVPTYPYIDLNRVGLDGGPSQESVGNAVGLALSRGFTVVLKPHLDPPQYIGGYTPPKDAKLGGNASNSWRGRFELDPMCEDYREGVVARSLAALKAALDRQSKPVPPVRLELGSELLASEAARPERWAELLNFAKKERARLGLKDRVRLSHNFAHHFEIAKDEVGKMTPAGRKALARYIKGLDAIALSQYMDLTVAVAASERGLRPATAENVAEALVRHERNFRRDILEDALGLKPGEVPPLHIGEFGVGSGGLKAPNIWSDKGTPEREKQLADEIALGHQGLALYLKRSDRLALSAILWNVGRHYDVFGWSDPALAIPAAADADRAYLKER